MKPGNLRGITGLRGLAAWLVVVYHFREALPWDASSLPMRFIGQGFLAVDLFFILSGVVLYINYHADFAVLNRSSVGMFYGKRLARIYPLHLVVLLAYLLNPLAILLFSSAASLGDRYDVGYFVMSLFLVQNWGFTEDLAWNIPAWSISTELAAYLLFPVLVLAIKAVSGRTRWPLLGVWLVCAALLPCLYGWTGTDSLGSNIGRLGVWRCILEFSMGLLIGNLFWHRRGNMQGLSSWALAGFAAWWCAALAFGAMPDYFVAPVAFSLLIVAFLNDESPIARLFGSRLPFFIGEISYSTYLVHYWVKDWVKFLSPEVGWLSLLVYLVVVLLLSMVLFHFVETRFRVLLYKKLSSFKTAPRSC